MCQFGGLTPEMSKAASEEATPGGAAQAEAGSDNAPEAGDSAPKVLGLGFAALNDVAGNTHTCSFVSID